MGNKVGAAFLRCALGPLHYAGGCIVSGKVADGLRELAVDSLRGGLERGVAEAAGQVGADLADVERLLPMADIEGAAARLDLAQRGAVAAWEIYAVHIGGLLKGVADLTVDGRAPDVCSVLERLSQKVIRDRPLADPLHTLSVAVGGWLDLVDRCGELLADGGVLARAHQRRRLRRILGGSVGVVVLGGALAVGLSLRAVRARVETGLAAADPCVAQTIAPGDLARASAAQKQRADERRVACDESHQRAAAALAEQGRLDDKAREDQRLRQDHEGRCEALAKGLEGGGDGPGDDALAAGKGPLLRRIARRALEKGDLAESELPCADTPAGARVAAAFAAAVVASPAAWANADDVSDRVSALLVEHRAELPRAPLQQLLVHADNLVKRAMIRHSASIADQAGRICKLKDDLGVRGAKYCATLVALRAAGKL